jgi:peptide-methionine (R)-S-oxide reductase
MKKVLILTIISFCFSCNGLAQKKESKKAFPITKTEAEWKAQLTDLQFYVLRGAGTEPAFSSSFNDNHLKGIYVCAACQTPVFKSDHKYDSGSGWPSFDREIEGNVAYSSGDEYYGIEEHCATCGGHLGHVFNDGPRTTTGLRHCINGAALKFIPKTDE